jgi:hypothetical protein
MKHGKTYPFRDVAAGELLRWKAAERATAVPINKVIQVIAAPK